MTAALLTGTALPGFEVVPEGARAALIIVHGIAEHGGRYRRAAEALAQNSIACFVYDQRGHGQTRGPRTHVDDFDFFARDLQQVGASIRRRFPALPIFVWGHSMGSVVVVCAALCSR
jgi:alpha-beta hydrolase superfamily lysophospholipase